MSERAPLVIFEDEELLVLNKPAGVIVNRADSVKGATLQDWIEEYLAQDPLWLEGRVSDVEFAERAGLGHRIDKDTSGVIVVGKTPAIMRHLLEQFQQRTIKKTYLALAHGFLPAPAGIIEAPIARDTKNRQRFTVDEAGRASRTLFHVVEEFAGVDFSKLWERWDESDAIARAKFEKQMTQAYQGFSLVSLQPKTGRTHQIRVHLKYLQHPIVGDTRYTSPKQTFFDTRWVPRQFLHASSILLTHPSSGQLKTFSAPLPNELQSVLDILVRR